MPDIFDTITIPKKDVFDRISLPHKKDIFDTLGTPIPQPLPEPSRQEQLAKESNDYGFNLLTGTASEAGKEAYGLARKTFSPFDIRNVTNPIAEVLSREVMSGKPPIQAYKDMGKGVARAGYDTLQGLSHAIGDPLGTTDIASGDLTFPTARQAWTERPYESAVGVSPILTPLLLKGMSAIPRRQPEIKISPEAKQAYTSGIQEIGQTLKNIPDEVRPQQARIVADLRNQMRSALFKDDVATINSIVADFREGQTIPTAQPSKPTLRIPSQVEIPTEKKEIIKPVQPLPKLENIEIVKPQPKGFTPIEAAPVETAQPKGFGKPQDLFAKPTEETKIVYGAIDEEVKLLEPKIPLRRRNELFEQARTEGAALMKKRMGVTDYTTLTKPIYRNLLKAEAEKQSAPIEASPVVSKEPLKPDMIVNMYEGDKAFHENLTPEMRQLIEKYKIDTDRNKENWAEVIDLEKGSPEIIIGTKGLGENDIKTTLLHEVAHVKTYEEGEIHPEFWKEMSILQQQKAPDKQIEIAAAKARELEAWQWAIDNASRYGHKIERSDLEKYKGSVRQLIPQLNFPLQQPKGFTPIEAAPIVSKEPVEFYPDDVVLVKGNNGLKDFEASFRGYSNKGKAVIFDKKTGNQMTVESDSLSLVKSNKPVLSATQQELKSTADYFLQEAISKLKKQKRAIINENGIKEVLKDFSTVEGLSYYDVIKQAESEGLINLKDYPELQQTHTMPSGEVMPGAEHKETSKFSQPKMFEGEKTNIVPKMEAEIQGQQKLFQPKAGQLTPEQLQQQTSDINIGREGVPSIKSDAEIRYAPGTGINLETLDLPPDVKHTIYKLTQQYQPQFEDARNRKTWEEINKEAESLGFDANQLLERQKGEAYNAAKLKATKDIQNNTALEAKRIADEAVTLALDAKLTADQQAEVLVIANMKMKKAAAILAQAGGAYSEAGRALNILRQVSGATKAQKNWEAILDALGGREMTLEMFKRIAGMDTTDTPQVAKFIREVQKARIPDMVSEAWRNAILSGTKTLITNPLSNAITFASNPIETGIAAVLEKGRSVITGKKPQVYFREVPAEIVGAIDGIWNGARVFLNTMKTEIPTFGETKIENAIMQTNIPGKLGRAIRVPQTILIAQDDAMKAVIYDSTMKTLATRLAISKGFKSKKEIVEFVGNLLTNPQGKNKRYFDLFDKRARADADYRTYNKALGKIGQILMRLRDQEFPKGSGIKPLYYVMPFMRTPTNIVKYGLERTPFNFARLGYKNYKGEIPKAHLSEEFAKPILGTIMFLWGWLMYEYGYMTGDAPKDVNDRATWYNAGKKPYSFYLPWLNKYISYQRIEPLGSIFGMVADFFEITNRGIANTKDAFTKILLSLTRNWTNKTFIMGATNAINAYTDPERYGDRFVDGLTSSLVPNIISSFNSDPYYRQKQTFLDSIKAKVPVLSETLPPKRDILGSPAKRGEGRGMALFNQILPFGVVKPSDDPVRKELLRLNDSISFSVGMPNKYFRRGKEKIDISADVYDAYSKESGELAYKLVNRIVKSKGYGKMDDENKASLIRKQFDVARDSVRPKYIRQLKQNPQIGR